MRISDWSSDVCSSDLKKTMFDVHAGGRRWRAIAKLIESGQLPKNTMVDTRVCNDEKAALAEEISLAENLIREAMSPADECRGSRAALDTGETEEDVARRLGVTVRHVQGRLRPHGLADPIFNKIGRAAGRERGCKEVNIRGVA